MAIFGKQSLSQSYPLPPHSVCQILSCKCFSTLSTSLCTPGHYLAKLSTLLAWATSLASEVGSLLPLFLPFSSFSSIARVVFLYTNLIVTSHCSQDNKKLPSRKLSALQPYFAPLSFLLSNPQPHWYCFGPYVYHMLSTSGPSYLPFSLLKIFSQSISYISISPPPFSATSLINPIRPEGFDLNLTPSPHSEYRDSTAQQLGAKTMDSTSWV